MTCLVDTNIILDLVTNDPAWANWSERQIAIAANQGPTVINDIVYAELCSRYGAAQEVDDLAEQLGLSFAALTKPALFAAGQAYRRYRRRGGPRDSLLPDFLIGAQAAVNEWTLLSRDPRRYRTDFPQLQVICP